MTPLICFLAISHEVRSEPIHAEFEEGKKIFQHKKGIDRTEKDARIVLGQWFDGERLEPVEEAVFLTPGLLSRWLGYQKSAGTPQDDIDMSWSKCYSQFSGKNMAIIRLARLCTVDMVDGDVDNSGNPAALDHVKIQIRQGSKSWSPVSFRTVQDIQQRRPEEVLKESWDQILAKFTAWPSKPTENELMPEVKWGKNRRITLIAEVGNFDAGSKCEFMIVEKDRTRMIPFTYPKS
jgi:hypothetical protein